MNNYSIKKETSKEWFARRGHIISDTSLSILDDSKIKNRIHDWLGPDNPSIPEFDFWAAFFKLTISDALGEDRHSKRLCNECHKESGDGCFNMKHFNGRSKRCTWKPHTNQRCALSYFNSQMAEDDCSFLGIEIGYVRRLLTSIGR